MKKVSITQKRSLIGYPKSQRYVMSALGFGRLGRVNKTIEQKLTPSIQGMLYKVGHLVTVKTN